MTTLHIIGNGFDLRHGIASSYQDFREYEWGILVQIVIGWRS